MKEIPLKNDVYDLTQLFHITKGDSEFTLSMLNVFVSNGKNILHKIQSEYQADNYAAIAEAAHQLWPSTEQLGLTKAASALGKIEKAYLRKNNPTKDPELIEQAISEINIAIHAIDLFAEEFKKENTG